MQGAKHPQFQLAVQLLLSAAQIQNSLNQYLEECGLIVENAVKRCAVYVDYVWILAGYILYFNKLQIFEKSSVLCRTTTRNISSKSSGPVQEAKLESAGNRRVIAFVAGLSSDDFVMDTEWNKHARDASLHVFKVTSLIVKEDMRSQRFQDGFL